MAEKIEDHHNGENQNFHGTNVLILSESGKPIFSRFGSEEDVANTCALLQAILSTAQENPMQSIKAGPLQIVIFTVQNITLIAISNDGGETEIYLRLLLEYVYAQIIFTLTEQIHQIVFRQQNFDLISLLGPSATKHLYSVLDQEFDDPGPMISAAVPILYPLENHLREHASRIIQNIGNEVSGLLYAFLTLGDKLVTMVQPKFQPYQLYITDIHLILRFVKSQPFLTQNEAWFPICLPMFHADGYLYTYTTCLDMEKGLLLILMSTNESEEQFATFREASAKMKRDFHREKDETGLDVNTLFHPINDPMPINEPIKRNRSSPLARGIDQALLSDTEESTFKKYSSISSAYHFLFRIDVSVPFTPSPQPTPPVYSNSKSTIKEKRNKNNSLSQCLSPPLSFPFVDTKSKRRVWNNYQRLAVRLKYGSASTNTIMSAYENSRFPNRNSNVNLYNTSTNNDQQFVETQENGILSSCPAIQTYMPASSLQGLTYILDESELFIGMNGVLNCKSFVLMAVLPATVDITEAATSCAKMVRQIIREESNLFLVKPLTWRQ